MLPLVDFRSWPKPDPHERQLYGCPTRPAASWLLFRAHGNRRSTLKSRLPYELRCRDVAILLSGDLDAREHGVHGGHQ